jgi:1A family penicillin-binding protein
MTVRKNFKKVPKKSKKTLKKTSTIRKKTVKISKNKFFLEKIFTQKKGRGRPSLSFAEKLQRFFRLSLHRFQKHLQVRRNKRQVFWQRFFRQLGLRRGRGRRPLSWQKRWQRQLSFQRSVFDKRWKDWQQFIFFGKKYFLRLFHLQKKRGRPKKKESLPKKIFTPKEVLSVRLSRQRRLPIKISFFVSLLLSFSFLFLSYKVYTEIFVGLPAATDLTTKKQNLTSKITDRNGNLLYSVYEDENRTLVPINDVSLYMRQATIAIEDKDFYTHIGFSPKGILRAFFTNITQNSMQGGSTITQQLVKNRLLSDEKTLARKIKELLLSVLVERVYSKDQILEMYLNTVAYGGSTYGVEEAAQRYFSKDAQDLDLAEAALLAGLPQSPSVYSPFGSNPEKAYERQAEVLRRMVEDGYVTNLQAEEARAEKLQFNQDQTAILAPHFVMYVRKILASMYGEQLLAQGGLEIRTSLDLDLQNLAQQTVTDEVASLKKLNIHNGAALVTNPKTGEILAMVGSVNYFDFASDGQVNVTIRPRQPGSSIKPLTYAVAFEAGKKPSSLVEDAPVIYQIPGSKPYAPKNYDGKFHGTVSLREALASSYNIPAVKTLNELGLDAVIDKGQELGIDTWQDRSRFGLSLTLGAAEVTMTDMAELYSSFANDGYPVMLNPLLEVRDAQGKLLYRNSCALDEHNCYQEQELSPLAAYYVTSILSDNQARTPAFGAYSVLNIPNQEVAVKTGTTNNLKDNWTIGYTDNLLVATWVGNNDSSPMSYVASGITGASPIWNKIMLQLLDAQQPHKFTLPDDLVKVKICAQTGTLACSECPKIVDEVFPKNQVPQQSCSAANFPAKPATE